MKAALKTEKGDFEVKDVETPALPGPDWVRVRVRVAGICGTDLRHWKVEDKKLAGKIMGHEMAGEVDEVGEAVKDLKKGDRVVVETVLGDDTCEWCRINWYNLCPNLYPVRMETISRAFAEYVIGPAKRMHKLPDHVSFEEAALLDTFSVCLHGIHLSRLKMGDKVAVIGAGNIGLGQLQLAKLSGAEVIVTDIEDYTLDLAKEFGADAVVNTNKEDGRQKVMEFTNNRGVDIVYECAGGTAMPITLKQATEYARIGGQVVIIGGFEKGQNVELDWEHIQKAEIQLMPSASYSYWGTVPEMKMCLDLLAAGKLNARKLISERFPLDRINEAFEYDADDKKTHSIFLALMI